MYNNDVLHLSLLGNLIPSPYPVRPLAPHGTRRRPPRRIQLLADGHLRQGPVVMPLQDPIALVSKEYEAVQSPATRKVTIYVYTHTHSQSVD